MAEVKKEGSSAPASGGQRSEGGQRPEGQQERRPRGGKPRYRKRVCRFCQNSDLVIDYKRVDIIVRSVSNKGKILPRRLTGNCAKHQRIVSRAIKRSRMAGLMPFTVQ